MGEIGKRKEKKVRGSKDEARKSETQVAIMGLLTAFKLHVLFP